MMLILGRALPGIFKFWYISRSSIHGMWRNAQWKGTWYEKHHCIHKTLEPVVWMRLLIVMSIWGRGDGAEGVNYWCVSICHRRVTWKYTWEATENAYEKNQVEKKTPQLSKKGWVWSLSAGSVRKSQHVSQLVMPTHGKPIWCLQHEAERHQKVSRNCTIRRKQMQRKCFSPFVKELEFQIFLACVPLCSLSLRHRAQYVCFCSGHLIRKRNSLNARPVCSVRPEWIK